MDATFKANIFKASCFRVNCTGVTMVSAGGLGGASMSTTRSLVGFELPFLVSTDRNSSISSHAEGSVKKVEMF